MNFVSFSKHSSVFKDMMKSHISENANIQHWLNCQVH